MDDKWGNKEKIITLGCWILIILCAGIFWGLKGILIASSPFLFVLFIFAFGAIFIALPRAIYFKINPAAQKRFLERQASKQEAERRK